MHRRAQSWVKWSPLRGGCTAAVLGMVLAGGCQRPPADVSAVAYRVVDEGRATGDCTACIITMNESACMAGGQAAALAWHLPSGMQATAVRIEAERMDGSRISLAQGGKEGRAQIPVVLQPEERVYLLDADSGKPLAFIRVETPLGCAPGGPQGGR